MTHPNSRPVVIYLEENREMGKCFGFQTCFRWRLKFAASWNQCSLFQEAQLGGVHGNRRQQNHVAQVLPQNWEHTVTLRGNLPAYFLSPIGEAPRAIFRFQAFDVGRSGQANVSRSLRVSYSWENLAVSLVDSAQRS